MKEGIIIGMVLVTMLVTGCPDSNLVRNITGNCIEKEELPNSSGVTMHSEKFNNEVKLTYSEEAEVFKDINCSAYKNAEYVKIKIHSLPLNPTIKDIISYIKWVKSHSADYKHNKLVSYCFDNYLFKNTMTISYALKDFNISSIEFTEMLKQQN